MYPLSIAPMMDRTDRHYRYFMRRLTKKTLLYTEMITVPALLHGDHAKLLEFSEEETPLSLQLGGDDPKGLATCAKLAEQWGYTEVNLNIGCPSGRVQKGNFGVCLMRTPEQVARCVEAMMAAVTIPVTVKHRIGVDELDRYEDMAHFVRVVSQAGVQHFTVHARKAWLHGLSPKENRTVPPLRYDDVYALKADFPQLTIEINGGIIDFEQAHTHLKRVDAVMLGRAAFDNPYQFALADQTFWNDSKPAISEREVIEQMIPYGMDAVDKGHSVMSVLKPIFNLFSGQVGTKAWKRHLAENIQRGSSVEDTLLNAFNEVQRVRNHLSHPPPNELTT